MSWLCPRCKTDNEKVTCAVCGFDSTMNYAEYRTISPLPGKAQSGFFAWDERREESRRLSVLFAQAERGDPDAQYLIACKYYNGSDPSIPQDDGKAAEWFERAARKGHVNSQSMLASCYETGKGVRESSAEALTWYEKAAAAGDVAAMRRLEILREREAERERQRKAERERQQEAEREKAREAERQRQQEAEKERARKAERERQQEAERERAREAERQRQQEAERERAREAERQRQQEAERERARKAERERAQEAERQKSSGGADPLTDWKFVGHTAMDKAMKRRQGKTWYDGSSPERAWKIKAGLQEAEKERRVLAGLRPVMIPPGLDQHEMLVYQDGSGRRMYVEHELCAPRRVTVIVGILLTILMIHYYATAANMGIYSAVAMGLMMFLPDCLPGLGLDQLIWSVRFKKYRQRMGLRRMIPEPALVEARVKRAGWLTLVTVILSLVLGFQCMVGEAFRIVVGIYNYNYTAREAFFMSGLPDHVRKEVLQSHVILAVIMLLIVVFFAVLFTLKGCSAMLLGLCCALASFGGAVVSNNAGFDYFLFWKAGYDLTGMVGIIGFLNIAMGLLIFVFGKAYFWGRLYLEGAKK